MRIKKLALLCAFLLTAVLIPLPAAAYFDLPEVDVQARSAILVHAQTDEILFSHNIHIRREPASVTKIITGLLAVEHGGFDEIVTAEEGDFFDIIPESSSINPAITPGEEMVFRDLIYSAMVASDNSACNIIARHVAGSVPEFMEMVNERLAELGCENTQFANTHGLPDPEHYTTAFDIYLIARECLNNAFFMEIAHTEYITLPPTNKVTEGRNLTTTNNLITRRRSAEYYYSPARGIKTGRTNNAGHCLVSAAERDGITLLSVVLGASVDEETNLVRSFIETRDLFEWGFANFALKRILSRVDKLLSLPVIQGVDQDVIFLVPERSVEALVPKHVNPEDIKKTIKVFEPEGVRAPVKAGDILGEVELSYQGHDYGTIPLIADQSVERDTREAIQDGVGGFFKRIFGARTDDPEDTSGSLSWIKWAVLVAIILVSLYIILVIFLNRRRRVRNMRSGSYRGRRKY
ncbi:MAG: D-alanyl-D-alanine carboxypeptidase [Oscillospiraceae bacterium]|nr:D-alanyl-D-alanine carboxypeptidase [Oscillospiraceae bacterium]